jgi:hypothetical protein
MHYIYLTHEEDVKEYFPIVAEVAAEIPDYAKEMAALAEQYDSHIEIDARTGKVYIIDGKSLEDKPSELHPTWQVDRAIRQAFINQKYGEAIPENIREIDIKILCPDFKGHLYCYIYITSDEYQQSIIVLDENGNYLTSYDELDNKLDPPVDGLDDKAVEACAKAFEAGAEMYKRELQQSAKKQVIH